MTDSALAEIQDLVARVARVLSGDIVWECPADEERTKQRARQVLYEIGQTHLLLSIAPEPRPSPDRGTRGKEIA